VLIGAAGAVNGVLGWFLLRHGRRHHSAAIEADGAHVLTDFWTSVGVVVGLVAVWLTGLWWFDPLVAAIMGAMLLVTGWRLVRRSGGALLDEEDPAFLRQLVAVLGPHVRDGIIRVHRMRAIRAGRFRHVSAHLVVPEFWTVEQAHDAAATLSASVVRELGTEAELEFHTDPCERAYCATCDLEACSVRAQPFQRLEPLTVDEAVAPEGKAHGR
jgi:cation diffusion facilitator family transporter